MTPNTRPHRSTVVVAVLFALLSGACAGPSDGVVVQNELVALRVDTNHGARTAQLVPAVGVRINARLEPRLEFASGTPLHLSSPQVTADSSYFTGNPTALLPARTETRGTLRASVCAAAAKYAAL